MSTRPEGGMEDDKTERNEGRGEVEQTPRGGATGQAKLHTYRARLATVMGVIN